MSELNSFQKRFNKLVVKHGGTPNPLHDEWLPEVGTFSSIEIHPYIGNDIFVVKCVNMDGKVVVYNCFSSFEEQIAFFEYMIFIGCNEKTLFVSNSDKHYGHANQLIALYIMLARMASGAKCE